MLPSALKSLLAPGDAFQVYRQHLHRWAVPFKVVRLVGKIALVTDGVNLKAFPRSAAMSTPAESRDANIIRAVKAIASPANTAAVHLVQELMPHDPRSASRNCLVAMEAEVAGFFKTEVFSIVPVRHVSGKCERGRSSPRERSLEPSRTPASRLCSINQYM